MAVYNILFTRVFTRPDKTNNISYIVLLTPFYPFLYLVHFSDLLITQGNTSYFTELLNTAALAYMWPLEITYNEKFTSLVTLPTFLDLNIHMELVAIKLTSFIFNIISSYFLNVSSKSFLQSICH